MKVRPGLFVQGEAWGSATPECRVATLATALDRSSQRRPLFSGETAAALHGLGLYLPATDRVHVISPEPRPGSVLGVVRHRGDIAAADVVERAALLCTSLERTVADSARTLAFDRAVTIADAALRLSFVTGPGDYDVQAAAAFKEKCLAIARQSAHGAWRAERVLSFADGRAQLPGESVGRVRMRELGFTRFILQVPIVTARGRFFVDIGLPEVDALTEFDGTIKYVDGSLTRGRSAADILDTEKQREDLVRGVTQSRFVRYGWPHIGTARDLGRRFAQFGISPPR